MAIVVKKFCQVCGKELKEIEEIHHTCTEGFVEVEGGYFCDEHSTSITDKEK